MAAPCTSGDGVADRGGIQPGPRDFERGEDGKLVAHRGSGGLVTVLGGVLERDDATWVGGRHRGRPGGRASRPEARRRRAARSVRRHPGGALRGLQRHRERAVSRTTTCGTAAEPEFRRAHRARMGRLRGGEPGVRTRARAEAKQDPVFPIQDYHLTLVPRMLRELVPEARILHFSHTRSPDGRTRTLPVEIRSAMLRDARGRRRGVPGPPWGENFLLSARSWRTSTSTSAPTAPTSTVARCRSARSPSRSARSRSGRRRRPTARSARRDREDPRRSASAPPGRPARAVEEHPAGIPRVRAAPPEAPSRARRVLPRAAQPVPRGGPGVPRLRSRLPLDGDRIAAFGKEDWTPIVVKVQEDFTTPWPPTTATTRWS